MVLLNKGRNVISIDLGNDITGNLRFVEESV